MREGRQSEKIISSLIELADNVSSKKRSVSFFEEESSHSMYAQFNRLFGRQNPIHHILGGGKSADVLLWRNKKISASVLSGATAVWILFEWLNYHFMSFVCFVLALGVLAQFLWSNASVLVNKSPSHVPRLVLPDELFVNIGMRVGAEANRGLLFIQDVACGGNLKQFLCVIGSLVGAAFIGSWCSFLTVLYVGFIAAHTLPVLYEKYDDKIDKFIYKFAGHLQKNYKKLDASLLCRIPTGRFRGRKYD
ncbi:unnamed protein product [Rhodiola kirilowii]